MTTTASRTFSTRRTVATTAAALMIAVGAALGAAAPATAAPPPAAATAAPATATAAAALTPTDAPTHAPVGTPNEVRSWYLTFLGRDSADDPGSRYWVDRLDSGAPREVVLGELLRSREYVTSAVATIYRAYLGRALDPGASSWVDGVVRGDRTLEGVEQEVAGSTELLLVSSGDGCVSDCGPFPGPVPTWYRVILDRAPSSGEVDYWEGQIGERGATDAVTELWYTPEAVAQRVQIHYAGLLKRPAGAGEVAYWYDREVRSDAAVVALIATSPEFRKRFPL